MISVVMAVNNVFSMGRPLLARAGTQARWARAAVALMLLVSTLTVAALSAADEAAAAPQVDVSGRILDSRLTGSSIDQRYVGFGPTEANNRIFLEVAGRSGVPANAAAAALNVTVVRGRTAGFVSIDDCSSPVPSTSNINFEAGQTIANLVVTRLNDDGIACIYTSGVSDLVVDVSASFANDDFTSVGPARILDTRGGGSTVDGSLQATGPVGPGEPQRIDVAGRGGVPAGTNQVVVNITAAQASGRGFFTAYQCNQSVPNTSNLNYRAGRNVARLSVVDLAADGSFCLSSNTRSEALVDVFGYFSDGAFTPVEPARLLETRAERSTFDGQQQGIGRFLSGETVELEVAGRGGVPANAGSVMVQVTATDQTASGFVTAFPAGDSQPTVSSLNHEPGVAVGNSAIVELGGNGNICLFSDRSVHMVVDVIGWFAGPPPSGSNSACVDSIGTDGAYPVPGRGPVSADQIYIEERDEAVVAADGTGNFRLVCGYSHMSYNDPLVAPGQPGRSHLHTFFGNTGVDADSTYESLRDTGNSTCDGGIANRSGYWIPSLIDGDAAVVPKLMFVYYKSGYRGVEPGEINNIPDGLRMIAGNSRARVAQSSEVVSWSCETGGSSEFVQTIPDCAAGGELRLTITFPQCWNGTDLDSFNHQSHLAYPGSGAQFGQGCPASHPVAIPVISTHVIWDVPAGGTSALFVSSDPMVDALPGASAHADFFEAWDSDIRDTFTENCIRGALDCGVRGLGNGLYLSILDGIPGLPGAKPVDGKIETGLAPVRRKLAPGSDTYYCGF